MTSKKKEMICDEEKKKKTQWRSELEPQLQRGQLDAQFCETYMEP